MTKDKIKVVEKSVLVPFIMLVSCFVLWGLLNNMTDNLVPAFGKIFMILCVARKKRLKRINNAKI